MTAEPTPENNPHPNLRQIAERIINSPGMHYVYVRKSRQVYALGYRPHVGVGWLVWSGPAKIEFELDDIKELDKLKDIIAKMDARKPVKDNSLPKDKYIIRFWKDGKSYDFYAKTEEEALLKAEILRKKYGDNFQIIRPANKDWKYGDIHNLFKEKPKIKELFEKYDVIDVTTKDGKVVIEYKPKQSESKPSEPKPVEHKSEPKHVQPGLIGGDAGLRVAASNESGSNVRIKIETKKIEINPPKLPKIDGKLSISDKITEKAVDLEYKAHKTSNIIKRLEIGAELACLGFAAGVINVGKSIIELGKEALHNPLKAGKDLITGTIDWFKSIPGKIVRGFTESPFYTGELAGEVMAGELVAEGLDVVSKPIPRPAFAKLTVLEGEGAEPELKTVRYGITIHSMERPLLTIAKTDEGIKVGRVLPAPSDAIEGKTITAYSDLETKFFEKTVEAHAKSPEHAEIFKTGYNIARKIYETNEPVTEPDKFEVLSEHIPDNAKPAVKEAIISYKGDIEVYGSVTQKLQMEGYMSRNPKDIEIVVDKPSKFVEKLREKLDEAGIEYKIEGSEDKPKVYFKIGDEWVKGIEIFSKKSKEGYFSLRGLFSRRSDIAYGFNRQEPIEVEGVEMLRLSEQAARKLEGGHVFKEGDIVPKHEGRWKDVNDLVEIGTAYAIEKGLPIEEDLVRYAKLQAELHGEYVESPVLKFIAEHGRLPTKEEIAELLRERTIEGGERELLFRREVESPIETMSDISSIILESSIFGGESLISPELSPELKERSSSIGRRRNTESSVNVEDESSSLNEASSEFHSGVSKSGIKAKGRGHSSIILNSDYESAIASVLSLEVSSSVSPTISSPLISESVLRAISVISPKVAINEGPKPKASLKLSKRRKNNLVFIEKIRKDEWNIFNKYNDPIKVGNRIVNEINKLLGGDILRL